MSRRYDLALFEELNEEYEGKPFLKLNTKDETGRLLSRAEVEREANERNLAQVKKFIDLSGKTVLELGCGTGQLVSIFPSSAGASRAIGVDIKRHSAWAALEGGRVEFICADVSRENPFEPDSIDSIISRVVFEHVTRPLQMLEELFKVLKPGGQFYLKTNLHRGPSASHLYREIFFPWPHLLFADEVFEEFYLKHYGRHQRPSWVNKMTASNYVQACWELGFEVEKVIRHARPIDLSIYGRFEEKLGRYPALDLGTNFMTLLMRKPMKGTRPTLQSLDYLGIQRKLDREREGVAERV